MASEQEMAEGFDAKFRGSNKAGKKFLFKDRLRDVWVLFTDEGGDPAGADLTPDPFNDDDLKNNSPDLYNDPDFREELGWLRGVAAANNWDTFFDVVNDRYEEYGHDPRV